MTDRAEEEAREIVSEWRRTCLTDPGDKLEDHADCLAKDIATALRSRDTALAEAEERIRALEGVLERVPLSEQSCHGRGGRNVCQGCGARGEHVDDMPHNPKCFVPDIRAALRARTILSPATEGEK